MHSAGPLLLNTLGMVVQWMWGDLGRRRRSSLRPSGGTQVSALMPEAIVMMKKEVAYKEKDDMVEVVCLDKIDHLLGTPEWVHL